MPEMRRSEVLRHVFVSCLIRENSYADAAVFFDEWLRLNRLVVD